MPENERLQVKVFVCHNALAQDVQRTGLEQLGLSKPDDLEQLPCLGKVDTRYLLKAFESGCDAVCLIGCPIGKCRTMDGNLRAQKRAAFVSTILEEIGIKGQRLSLFFREPMEESATRELLGEFLATARSLGPSELKIRKETEPI